MASDLTQTFMGRHVEKIVLGAAAAVLVVSAVLFVGLRTPHDSERRNLQSEISRIRQDMEETTLDKILGEEGKKQLGFDEATNVVEEIEKRPETLPAPWEPKLLTTGRLVPSNDGDGKTVLEPPQKPGRVLPVTDLRVAVGRGMTNDASAPGVVAKVSVKNQNYGDILWVSCVGRFDLTEELAEFVKAKAPPDTEILVTRVDLQRRTLRPDGRWSDWEPVTSAGPASVKLPNRPANSQERAAVSPWWSGLRTAQALVRHPPFYALVAKDSEAQVAVDVAGEVPTEEPSVRVPATTKKPEGEGASAPAPTDSGATATSAKPDWFVTGGTSGGSGATAHQEAPHVFATVWAHDLSVQPGQTYQYRMRGAVFNPAYAPPLSDAAIRWALDFDGEWSEPTENVAVKPIVEFYFVGAFRNKANLQLHRWIHGQWVIMPSVPTNIGGPVVCKRDAKLQIPVAGGKTETVTVSVDLSPDVLLVDMIRDFPYYPQGNRTATRTGVLIYTDAQGRVGRRIDWEDNRAANELRQVRESEVPQPPAKKGGATPAKTPTKTPAKTPKSGQRG